MRHSATFCDSPRNSRASSLERTTDHFRHPGPESGGGALVPHQTSIAFEGRDAMSGGSCLRLVGRTFLSAKAQDRQECPPHETETLPSGARRAGPDADPDRKSVV